MINRNNDIRSAKPSFVPKFSDPDILKAVLNSEFWGHIFLGEKKAAWLFFKALALLKTEMFVSPLRMYLRHGHGRRTVGVTITLLSASMMMAFNSESALGALATFVPFIAPAVPFFMSGKELWDILFVDIRSQYLMYFWTGYVIFSTVHLVRANRGRGTAPAHRGTPFLQSLLSQKPDGILQVLLPFLEPMIAGGIGYALMASGMDTTFGLFLVIAASCLLFQEAYDAVMKFSIG